MGFMQSVKKVFSTGTETRDDHHDERFKTHYYKSMKDKAMKDVEEMFRRKNNYTVASVSEEHGEIIIHVKDKKKVFLVATVIMVRPMRTAVDFSASTETILFTDFGHSRRLIVELYKELDKRLPFAGIGLGDNLSKKIF
ncbi:DUF1499 domain-containing protein [Salipaludibacillus sp. HK11]|uniref:DUF1499 domain-containing protein n=1 Tax=Salipaludibacillus sp. HK11 TaxID=3394320 RepID=UPI0039FDC2B0